MYNSNKLSPDTYSHLNQEMMNAIREESPWDGVEAPNKHSHVLENRENGTPLHYLNVMSCSLPGQWAYWKTIQIHEDFKQVCQTSGLTYASSASKLPTISTENLTPLRCAIYASALVNLYEQIQKKQRGYSKDLNVAIVGAGKLGSEIARAFDQIRWAGMDFPSTNLYIVRKQKDHKVRYGTLVDSLGPLLQTIDVDVVITCTNEWRKESLFSCSKEAQANSLWIAFDGGYFLGPQFRDTPSPSYPIADDPGQLMENLATEFPWDEDYPDSFDGMWPGSPVPGDAIYVYGTAIADAVIMKTLYERDLL